MAELWITEYVGFMKDFRSFTMKSIHSFHVFSTDTDLFPFKLGIWEFLLVKFSKTEKVIAILILMALENFSLHYQFGFQLNPGKIGIYLMEP